MKKAPESRPVFQDRTLLDRDNNPLVAVMTEHHDRPPEIAVARQGGCYVFRCPACLDVHTHGAIGGQGHRVSHCTNRDAFPRGYTLTEAAEPGLAGNLTYKQLGATRWRATVERRARQAREARRRRAAELRAEAAQPAWLN